MRDSPSAVGPSGLTLLSPRMERGLRATTVNNQQDERPSKTKAAVFDFDGFTLEAVRRRHDAERQHSFLHSAASSSGGSPRSPSLVRGTTRLGAGYDRFTSLDGLETRSMDDYEWGHRGTHMGTASSAGRVYQHMPSFSSVGTLGKRISMASSTTSSAVQGGGGSQRVSKRAQVVMRGWLQRRRGRVIKRWKAQFCVLKTDHKLCLYANEDTVNGRLEGRFQVLRVTYHEKNGSFQVIGIGSDETPYKEEFRPMDDDAWRLWLQALRDFFDQESLREAVERMPELSLVPGIGTALMEEEDDVDGDFAQQLEEMIMRPYASLSSGTSSNQKTPSSTTSSAAATATSSASSAPCSSPFAPVHSAANARRKTISLSNQAARRASVERILTAVANGSISTPPRRTENISHRSVEEHELPEFLIHGRAAVRSRRGTTTSDSTRSKASSIASNQDEYPVEPLSRAASSSTSTVVPPTDCPMIERDSQNTMAILEGRGSGSVVSNSSDGGMFSWHR